MSFSPILTRVLVYDPNPFLANSICNGLELCGPFTAKSCSGDVSNLTGVCSTFRPNIIVLDPARVPLSPEQLTSQVTRDLPNCEILGYVADGDRTEAERCLAGGFVGAVSQGRGLEALIEALEAAKLGGIYVDQCFARFAERRALELVKGDPDGSGRLSERERYVMEHVARGFSNKEIAGKLGLSPKTIETYRSRAAGKLGLRRKTDIVQYALRNNWLG